jgi:urea transport system substrate-binding protein
MNAHRSTFLKSPVGILAVALGLIVMSAGSWYGYRWMNYEGPIRVGLLHSLTGPMAISEKSMVDAEILALEQINASGGLLGRELEWVVADGKSDWPTFAREAERLIRKEKVDVIVGCWTSASRKMVKQVVESNKHLLIYPMAFEGLEQSDHIVYTGSAPNQQIIPAVTWAMKNLKAKRFYLVGSDYIWPQSVNEIIKDVLDSINAEVAGESYLYFGTDRVDHVIEDIKATKPDVIISTVVGDSNKAFYGALYQAGIKPSEIPVISFSVAEDELNTLLQEISTEAIVGNYSAWNYFQSVDRVENRKFIQDFRNRFGQNRSVNDVVTASFNSVQFWAQAVREAESTNVEAVVNAIGHQSLDAAEGIVSIDSETKYTWRPVYIGKAQSDGQFQIVWSSEMSIRPVPYPPSRSKKDWEEYLQNLYSSWDNTWANPRDDAAKLKSVRQSKSDPEKVVKQTSKENDSPPAAPSSSKPEKPAGTTDPDKKQE